MVLGCLIVHSGVICLFLWFGFVGGIWFGFVVWFLFVLVLLVLQVRCLWVVLVVYRSVVWASAGCFRFVWFSMFVGV